MLTTIATFTEHYGVLCVRALSQIAKRGSEQGLPGIAALARGVGTYARQFLLAWVRAEFPM